jgi:hypothetical protein
MHQSLNETCCVVDSVADSPGYTLCNDLRQPMLRCVSTSVRSNLRDWTGERVRSLVIENAWSSIEDAALDYFKTNE